MYGGGRRGRAAWGPMTDREAGRRWRHEASNDSTRPVGRPRIPPPRAHGARVDRRARRGDRPRPDARRATPMPTSGPRARSRRKWLQLLNEKFDRSGEFVTVAWEGADDPGASDAIDRFVAEARTRARHRRCRGRRACRPTARSASPSSSSPRRGWDVPPETGQELIRLAEQSSTDDVRDRRRRRRDPERRGGREPGGHRHDGRRADPADRLRLDRRRRPAARRRAVRPRHLGRPHHRARRLRRRARLRARRGRPDRHRRRRRLRAARAHPLPRRARDKDAARGRSTRPSRPPAAPCWSPARPC